MIVIERDGKTVVITGWRAWLLAAVAFVVTTAVLCSTGVPGSRHRSKHRCVSTDRHASGRYRGAGGMVFPTAESVINAGGLMKVLGPMCGFLHQLCSEISTTRVVPRRPLTQEHLSPPSTKLGGCF
jgi:hypothetical protein